MRAKTVLWTIFTSNLLFGVHFLLWKLGYGFHNSASIDPFAGYLAMWLLLFYALAITEAVAIIMDYFKGNFRIAVWASFAWVLQLGVIHFQYWMVNGV